MSEDEGLTISKLAVNVFGAIVLALGLVITFYSMQADVGAVDPGILTAAWEG